MQPWEESRAKRPSVRKVIKALTVSMLACTYIYGSLIYQSLKQNKEHRQENT